VVLPKNYPYESPYVYLDEKEDPEIIEIVDYLDSGNIIKCGFLFEWDKNSQQIKAGGVQMH
jgi:hypothetical protein